MKHIKTFENYSNSETINEGFRNIIDNIFNKTKNAIGSAIEKIGIDPEILISKIEDIFNIDRNMNKEDAINEIKMVLETQYADDFSDISNLSENLNESNTINNIVKVIFKILGFTNKVSAAFSGLLGTLFIAVEPIAPNQHSKSFIYICAAAIIWGIAVGLWELAKYINKKPERNYGNSGHSPMMRRSS